MPGHENAQNVMLQPFDTVRIFGRYDFEDPPLITVSGEVRHPGEHVTNGATRLRDAVYLAGGITQDALLTDAQVFRRTADGKLKVLSVNLERALAGDAADNVPLEPKDRIFIHRNLSKVDPPTVKIEGEVARPGKYPLGEDHVGRRVGAAVGRAKARSLYRSRRPDALHRGKWSRRSWANTLRFRSHALWREKLTPICACMTAMC